MASGENLHRSPVAEIKNSSDLSGFRAKQFGDIFTDQIDHLSIKPELSDKEITFLDTVIKQGSSMIAHMLDRQKLALPDNKGSVYDLRLDGFRILSRLPVQTTEVAIMSMDNDVPGVLAVTQPMAAGVAKISTHPHLRERLQDYAVATVKLISDLGVQNDSLPIDGYMREQIEPMMARFEAVEQAESRL